MRFGAEIDLLRNSHALTPTSLADAEAALAASEHEPFPYESRRLIQLIADDRRLHAEAFRLAAGAAAINELEHEDASSKARSEEHTSELQSLMRISYAVFCLKKKNKKK